MRCVFLMKTLSGFFSRCIEALASFPDIEILVICEAPRTDAPYEPEEVTPAGVEVRNWNSPPDGQELLKAVSDFDPQVVLICGWEIQPYRHVALKLSGRALRVLYMDNQWLATPKQYLGVATSRLYIHPYFDIAFLPGRNQEVFATKLGFGAGQIWRGACSCDYDRFAGAATAVNEEARRLSFVFVGRLVSEKGVDTLAEAYAGYRSASPNPWGLEIYGTGPMAGLFDGAEGVALKGFVQPRDLAGILSTAGCLVIPSRFEPWGAVIHEATASRLPVICTNRCGAAPHLVEDGANGYVIEPGNPRMLTRALLRISEVDQGELAEMRIVSERLAGRYTPKLWAKNFRTRSIEAIADQGPTFEKPAGRASSSND